VAVTRVAILGGGGFRTPLAYMALQAVAQRVGLSDLVLHDVDPARLEHMSLVLDGLAAEAGRPLLVRRTTDLEQAVADVDFVWCAIRVGGLPAREVDERIPVQHGVIGQETTGPGGIAFALRTVPSLLRIAEVVARLAPRAWFINFTNPVGMTTEAVQRVLGDRAIGVCDTPTALCRRVARALGREIDQLWFDYFGLNHLGWLRAVLDGPTDRMPGLLADERTLASIEEAALLGTDYLRRIGMLPNEYLAYYVRSSAVLRSLRAGAGRAAFLVRQQGAFYSRQLSEPQQALQAWRAAWLEREQTYMAEVATTPRESTVHAAAVQTGYAEVAADLLEALVCNRRRVMVLNVRNRSSLPFLDRQAVVEVPCVVGAHGATPVSVGEVPDEARELILTVKQVERHALTAATEDSRSAALQALALHPLVPSPAVAERILDGYIAAQPGLRERFRAA
jgi:6-phospho-beta-glucosidase